MQISAVLITFNEEENIAAAIESLGWADEILVVDSESSDRTRSIAEGMGARVIVRPWPGFSEQKQFAVDAARHDWIFSIDADERVSPELAVSITAVKQSQVRADGYRISRLPFYMGRAIRHGGWYPDRQVRLFDRRKGKWKNAVIHESVVMDDESHSEDLKGDIFHFTVRNALEHHRTIGDRYAPLGALQMQQSGRTTGSTQAAASGLGTFLKTYIVRLGFMDGFPGFCIAWFAAHNAFLKHVLLLELKEQPDPPTKTPVS
ncbi:MAG: glycosyltransferase family 2 protein [Acidobacteriota bacterium]